MTNINGIAINNNKNIDYKAFKALQSSPKLYISSINEYGEIIDTITILMGYGAELADFSIIDINIQDIANTKNYYINTEIFEGVEFIQEQFSYKNINLKIYLNNIETKKNIQDLIYKLKQIFAYNKQIIKMPYMGNYVYLKTILNNINFEYGNCNIVFANISLIGEAFFQDNIENKISKEINTYTHLIYKQIQESRYDLNLKIIILYGEANGVQINNLTINQNLINGDIIELDYQTGIIKYNNQIISGIGILEKTKGLIKQNIIFQEKIIYPSLNQTLDSLNGLDGSSETAIYNYTSVYRTIKHYFPTNNITNLKKIIIGYKNEFSVGVEIIISVYDGNINNYGNQLYLGKTKYYAGQDFEDIIFKINGNGINIANKDHLLIIIQLYPISYVSGFIGYWKRTTTGQHGTGTSYNNDNEEVDWTWNIKLEGYSGNYEEDKIIKNINKFKYELIYKNKYV